MGNISRRNIKIKNRKFLHILNSSEFADIELILKTKKLTNGKFAIATCYELSQDQLKLMGIAPKKNKGRKVMPVKSKAPKWFAEFVVDLNHRLDVIEKDINEMKNTPTMKRELDKK